MLNGKTAWVTGASRGLGRAIARQLAGQGCRVALIARDSEALRALAAELGGSASRAFPADLADREQVLRLASEASAWAPPDVLVNARGWILHVHSSSDSSCLALLSQPRNR